MAAEMIDLAHVVPGYYVAGIEPLYFTAEGAIEDGELGETEWSTMSEEQQEEFLKERKQEFRKRNNIQFEVNQAMRIELVAGDLPR